MTWNYFEMYEFQCPCCATNETQVPFINKLDRARKIAGVPFKITSGYRCSAHNTQVGGVVMSAHRDGVACDIACTSSSARFRIVHALIEVGFTRIGIGRDFIHVDMDDRKPNMLIWLY